MNAERLHAIALAIRDDLSATAARFLLGQLDESPQLTVREPTPPNQPEPAGIRTLRKVPLATARPGGRGCVGQPHAAASVVPRKGRLRSAVADVAASCRTDSTWGWALLPCISHSCLQRSRRLNDLEGDSRSGLPAQAKLPDVSAWLKIQPLKVEYEGRVEWCPGTETRRPP
jgi:hypothetical protein